MSDGEYVWKGGVGGYVWRRCEWSGCVWRSRDPVCDTGGECQWTEAYEVVAHAAGCLRVGIGCAYPDGDYPLFPHGPGGSELEWETIDL